MDERATNAYDESKNVKESKRSRKDRKDKKKLLQPGLS